MEVYNNNGSQVYFFFAPRKFGSNFSLRWNMQLIIVLLRPQHRYSVVKVTGDGHAEVIARRITSLNTHLDDCGFDWKQRVPLVEVELLSICTGEVGVPIGTYLVPKAHRDWNALGTLGTLCIQEEKYICQLLSSLHCKSYWWLLNSYLMYLLI